MAIPVYSTGTVSVAANGTDVSNGGSAIWSNGNVKEGDWIVIDGEAMTMVLAVVDTEHITIPEWQGGAKTNVSYAIYQNYSARDDSSAIARDVGTLVAALNKEGFIWFVGPDEEEPDPSRGDEGQYAEQPSTGKRWIKQSGTWSYLGQTAAIFSRYDIASFDTDRPASGELLLKLYPPGVTFRAGMTDSRAGSEVAATGSAVFSLTKSGVQFATLTFSAASAVGVISCPVDTSFTAGDVLRVIAPTPRDATLSGVAATFIGYR
jgi:hypothetical protein